MWMLQLGMLIKVEYMTDATQHNQMLITLYSLLVMELIQNSDHTGQLEILGDQDGEKVVSLE